MGAHEEEDPAELQEVVENEVTADRGSRMDVVSVGGEEVPDVADLEDE